MLALRRSKNAYVDAPYSLVAGLKTESRQNFTNTGRNGPRVKTKTVLKPVNKKEQLGGMPKMKKDKNLNKNPPTTPPGDSPNHLSTQLKHHGATSI